MSDAPLSSPPLAGAKAWASLALGASALVFAIVTNCTHSLTTLLLSGFTFLFAIILGALSKREEARSGARREVVGPAGMGIILAALALAPILVGRAESIRWVTARASGINNLKQFGLAMQAYQEEHGRLPPAAVRAKDGRPLLSWRVLLLPYLAEKDLFNQFHLDESWDGPHNRRLLERMPRVYASMLGNPSGEPNTTFYQVFVGEGTVFGGEELTVEKIDGADGCANTILVIEAAESVPWTKPADLPFRVGQRLAPLGDFYRNEHYINPRGRFLALFADGSVRCFYHDTPEQLIRPLVTWIGGEEVDSNELEPWCSGMRGHATLGQPRP